MAVIGSVAPKVLNNKPVPAKVVSNFKPGTWDSRHCMAWHGCGPQYGSGERVAFAATA